MHESVYTALLKHEDDQGDMVFWIGKIGAAEVFAPIIAQYSEDVEEFNKVLFYILHCYSRDSEMHINQSDWENIKKEVAHRVGLEPNTPLYEDVVELAGNAVAETCQRYLDYQGDEGFKHLCMVKDLYTQMVNASIRNITDQHGNVNYDQKMKNAKYAKELYAEIQQWRQVVKDGELKVVKAREQVDKKAPVVRSLAFEDLLLPDGRK